MEYNHKRPIEDFEKKIDIIKQHGFNVIGVSQMYFYDTFIFETTQEALKAYEELEKNQISLDTCILGWWYGKEDFEKTSKTYEKETGNKLLIHWL